jgi:hypothetical protein
MSSNVCNGHFVYVEKDGVIDKTNVRCNYCSATFKYHHSLSSLKYHLQAKHPYIDHRSTVSVSKPGSHGSVASSSIGNSGSVKQATLDRFCRDSVPMSKEKNLGITQALASWISESARPFNIVNDPGLREVICIASGSMGFTMPNRQTIKNRVDAMFDAQKAVVQTKLNSALCVALTADYWTSVTNDSYLGIVSHFIDDSKLLAYTLAVQHSTERHFAHNCAEEFESVAKQWNIHEKVTTFSTDNAANMIAAVHRLPYRRLSCSAHSLQLAVNKAVAACDIEDLLVSCRKIVGHFKHSAHSTLDLEKV